MQKIFHVDLYKFKSHYYDDFKWTADFKPPLKIGVYYSIMYNSHLNKFNINHLYFELIALKSDEVSHLLLEHLHYLPPILGASCAGSV